MISVGRASRVIVVGASCIVVCLGLAMRLSTYLYHPALGLDEAMVALNVATRSSAMLLRPLAFEQTAPALFLLISKASVLVWGVNERALRVTPFVAGLALVPLAWYAARRLLSTVEAAALTTAFAAVCPIVSVYADFFKPYAVDAAMAALILVLTLRVVAFPGVPARWWVLGTACSLGPFLSAPAAFVVVAAIAAIAVSPAGGDPTYRRHLRIMAAVSVASVAVNFLALQRATVQNSYMQRYWNGAFIQPPISHMVELARARIGWTVQELFLGEGIAYPGVLRVLLVVVAVGGLYSLSRRHGRWVFVLLAGPVLAAVTASALRIYPLSERTLVFVAPTILIAMAGGLEAVAGVAARRSLDIGGLIFAVLATLLLTPATVDGVLRLQDAMQPDQLRAAVADFDRHARPNEHFYIFSRDVPILIFYTTDWSSPDTLRIRLLSDVAASTGPNSGNMPSRGHPVENEGEDYIVHAGARVELIGVPTGMEARFADVSQQTPDPGWAANEAKRIRAAASPEIWLFFTHCHNSCDSTLADTLTAAGGRIAYHRGERGAEIYEYLRNSF